MLELETSKVQGWGGPDGDLTRDDLRAILIDALQPIARHSRILALIPDATRDDNTDLLFPLAAEILSDKSPAMFDALVAQGTHAPMSTSEKRAKIGAADFAKEINPVEVYDHNWDKPEELVTLGVLEEEFIERLSGGLIKTSIPVRLNRMLSPGNYEVILVFGATVPHEVAGFAGGAKYFFPGVAGPDLTHQTHWLGALAGIENVIGKIETPARALIEAAADFVTAHIISLNSVVRREDDGRLRTYGLFAGDIKEAFRKAANLSRQIHIRYTGRKYKTVVALLDEHYTEMWVGGKASYKLGNVISEGGELIIYAPHLNRISDTHGALISKYGYAPIRRVLELVEESSELRANLCVAAHLAHVSFANSLESADSSRPRFRITMATGLDLDTCRKVNLGWRDVSEFHLAEYENNSDVLIVKNAGRDLYLVD